jgi:IS5 family transposase
MRPPLGDPRPAQPDLFRPRLLDIVDAAHPLVRLADAVDWPAFEKNLAPCFSGITGRQAKPVRLMVGLQYLKFAFDCSDEGVLAGWMENPYWQYFCGGTFFEHAAPVDASSLTRWRGHLREAGAEEMLMETIRAGLRGGFIKPAELARVNVDTTVQEKNIRFPTDARLLDRSRERLVKRAKSKGLVLRQTFARVGKRALRQQSAYAAARQYKRARREERKLRTYLGRVVRDIERKCNEKYNGITGALTAELENARRLLMQKKTDSHKLYSLHEPQVECIAKGKAHKRYEFGCKASLVTSARTNWILGARAFHGNPYDGHTLAEALKQAARLTGTEIKQATCDLGYRGHDAAEGACDVQIVRRRRKGVPKALRYWWKRRSAIEPVIGHVKAEHRMDRNRLGGIAGDKLNAILSACGFNMRKLLRGYAAARAGKPFFCFLRHLTVLPGAFGATQQEDWAMAA